MSLHFRITFDAFGETYDERQLLKWANRFFVAVTWSKPVLCGKLEDTAYDVRKLQRLLATNLKNWGAKSSQRYRRRWITKISPWDFSQSSPSKATLAKHRLERLAAILSPRGAGLRAFKENAKVSLAKRALDKATARMSEWSDHYNRTISDPHIYNNAEEMAILKAQERGLIEHVVGKRLAYEAALDAAVAEDGKRRRTETR